MASYLRDVEGRLRGPFGSVAAVRRNDDPVVAVVDCRRRVFVQSNRKHRDVRECEDPFGGTPQSRAVDPSPAVGSHRDQIVTGLDGSREDLAVGDALANFSSRLQTRGFRPVRHLDRRLSTASFRGCLERVALVVGQVGGLETGFDDVERTDLRAVGLAVLDCVGDRGVAPVRAVRRNEQGREHASVFNVDTHQIAPRISRST